MIQFASLQEMATCAEGVVRHLTERFPDAPVVRIAGPSRWPSRTVRCQAIAPRSIPRRVGVAVGVAGRGVPVGKAIRERLIRHERELPIPHGRHG